MGESFFWKNTQQQPNKVTTNQVRILDEGNDRLEERLEERVELLGRWREGELDGDHHSGAGEGRRRPEVLLFFIKNA